MRLMDQEVLELILEHLRQINTRLDSIERRLDKIENRLDKIETRLDKIESKLDKVEKEVKRNSYKINYLMDNTIPVSTFIDFTKENNLTFTLNDKKGFYKAKETRCGNDDFQH